MPTSYKIKWRLLNALIKFLLVIEKDTEEDYSEIREKMIATANRWAPKNIKLESEWEHGHNVMAHDIEKAIDIIDGLPWTQRSKLLPEAQLAYMAIHNKYRFVAGEGCQIWPQELGEVPDFTDKQIIKALNCLRAKKDLVLV